MLVRQRHLIRRRCLKKTNLVELLQVMNRRPLSPSKRLLAVMVSAWDVVQPTDVNPEEWLRSEPPDAVALRYV